jgi:uncharacterized OB-fold protein
MNMNQVQSVSIECYKCKSCGKITLDPKKVCSKCGGTEMEVIEADGKGKVLDFTIIYFPPDDYKDLAPYTSVLVQLNNGLKIFGLVEGEYHDIPLGAPARIVARDKVRGSIIFALG